MSQDRLRAGGGGAASLGDGQAPDQAEEDMLAVTFDQLPARWQRRGRAFDWSGGTNYTAMHRKVLPSSHSLAALTNPFVWQVPWRILCSCRIFRPQLLRRLRTAPS